MNFESKTELEARKAEKRKARAVLLDEAKRKYDIEEKKIAAAKAKGEDKWMLPELSENIDKQSKKLKKKVKKLKKEKKNRKEKKKKKGKTKAGSSSESEASDDEQWVEKSKKPEVVTKTDESSGSAVVKGPVLQRDDWMTLDSADIPTVSRLQLREKIQQDKLQYADQKNQPKLNIDEPGTHEKELNPYWKSGAGSGLPEENKPEITVPKHNLSFLKQAYARCEKQAEETGESLDAIASERYGSLAQLQVMIMEAERDEELAKVAKNQPSTRLDERDVKHPSRRDRNRSNSRDRTKRNKSRSHSRDRTKRNRSRSRSRDRNRSRSRSRDRRNRNRSRSRDRGRGNRQSSRSRDRSRRNRSSSRDRQRQRRRSASRIEHRKGNNGSRYNKDRLRSRSSSTSGRSSSRGNKDRKTQNIQSSPKAPKRFMRPGEMDDQVVADKPKRSFIKPGESMSSHTTGSNANPSKPSWKKPGYQTATSTEKDQENKSMKTDKKPSSDVVSSSGSSVESDSTDSEPEQEVVVALTDDEMNALGAKILKAELMGNEDTAKELKQKLELARQARAAGVKPPSPEKEKVVVLSHADKFGNIRSVESQDAEAVKGGGKRRRARKAPTHNKSGERERYFADDDKFNIKDMVQAEKMTSAEDHHLMFSNMAAKVTEKIDDDNQIDDAMINRARLQHDPNKEVARQQQQAHSDSKKLAQALDNCQYCLENMTKHLVIAVSKMTYLCVPEYQSLTEGHCRIIPIHHCISSTTCDEDVWNEVQEFRQALVKMFAANDDQDCVFMECSKNLRKHPHMVVECIPIERELGDTAPIYFKKAIDESEHEWAQNKKLVDLSKKDIRHSVPKGFPYFSVDFGMQGGFAHVIEDEQSFPAYFGKEVVGGMMDVDTRLWRKPRKEVFEDQRKKVMTFANMWKPFDFTKQKTESDSE